MSGNIVLKKRCIMYAMLLKNIQKAHTEFCLREINVSRKGLPDDEKRNKSTKQGMCSDWARKGTQVVAKARGWRVGLWSDC